MKFYTTMRMSVTCKNINEAHYHIVQWKKPDTKENIAYDSTHLSTKIGKTYVVLKVR